MIKEAAKAVRNRLNGHSRHVYGGISLTLLAYLAGDAYRDIRAKADRVPVIEDKVEERTTAMESLQVKMSEAMNIRLQDNRIYNEGEWSNQRAWNSGFGQDVRDQRKDIGEIKSILQDMASDVKVIKDRK